MPAENAFTVSCKNNLKLTLRAFENGIVRMTASGFDSPDPSLLERYGIVEEPAPASASIEGGTLKFGEYELEVRPDTSWALRRNGAPIAATAAGNAPASAPTEKLNKGYRVCLQVAEGERFLGLGDNQRKQLLLNGLSGELWIRNPVCHVPVPFVMSSRGYGIFFNTTRKLCYNIAKTDATKAVFAVEKSFLDIYILTGKSFADLIGKFTMLTGRPHLPAMKSFGIWVIMYYWSTCNDVQNIASGMRERRMPCDNISLEPGWMEKNYDQSVTRDWSEHRFTACPAPYWRGAVQHMIQGLDAAGYNIGLWLCCRWDLTVEEERRAKARLGETEAEASGLMNVDGVEYQLLDQHMTGAAYLDGVTKRDQAWFDHLKKFVDDGVKYFKLDGCALMSEYPDRLYANGKTDEEMHNLAFLLEAKQTFGDYETYTSKRSYGIYPCATTGVQRYAGTWCGDTGGGRQPMIGLLQNCLVGHTLCTCDVENDHVQGIHMGYLLPWTIVDCWAAPHYPGFLSEELNAIGRDYSNLRMQLVEYYYSLAFLASRTGMPIMRPLCLAYPDEDWAYSQDMMFMVGDFLLADVFSGDDVRLPNGKWYDMWSGEVHEGNGKVQKIPVPKNRGGHLFLREGSLVPTLPVRQYVDPKAVTGIEWLVFPGREASFDLYLDDGETLGHREGEYAVQTVTLCGRELDFGAIRGGKPGFLENVKHTVRIVGA